MKLAYISGPYRASTLYGISKNIEAARDIAVEYWKKGYSVICPHANTAFCDGVIPDEGWIQGDLVQIERCDLIVMIPGWKKSKGAKRELAHATKCGVAVEFYKK